MEQEYLLGQWLRRRYSNYLDVVYNANDIYVRSSDVDRALMSAQSTVAGLYPPYGTKIWNRNLLWQPIPVHTIPVSMDHLIASQPPTCREYDNAMQRYEASVEMKKYHNSVRHIYDYIEENTGERRESAGGLMITRDAWLCESIHKSE